MRFYTGINYQRAFTSPVLVFNEALNSMNIMGRIAASESDPQKIVEMLGQEVAVVTDYYQWEW